MLIIIFMQDSSVILSDDPITMRLYFQTKILIINLPSRYRASDLASPTTYSTVKRMQVFLLTG